MVGTAAIVALIPAAVPGVVGLGGPFTGLRNTFEALVSGASCGTSAVSGNLGWQPSNLTRDERRYKAKASLLQKLTRLCCLVPGDKLASLLTLGWKKCAMCLPIGATSIV